MPQVNAASSNNSENEINNVNNEATETIQQKSESLSESVVQDPARDEPKIAAVELNTSDEVAQQTIDAQPQQVDIEQNTVNNADESVPDTNESLNEQKEDQPNLNFNAVPTDHAIIAADEDLDLNEIVYDGEIVVASEDEDEEEKAQFIDFFCDETFADDEREEEDSTNNEYNMIDDGPQVTRKRKRGFSLESVVFRNVKQKVQHVTVKQEAKGTPEKESLQNISKDSQMSPIMRAIFASKIRKNNASTNNNNNNENSSPRTTNNTTRRVTRSAAKNSSNSSEDSIESTSHNNNNKTKKNKNNSANKRRASSHQETSLKKENQAVDSPRILIYNERTLRRGPLPKMEKKEKKEKERRHQNLDVMDCVTCGQPIPASNFSHHLEKCYSKVSDSCPSTTLNGHSHSSYRLMHTTPGTAISQRHLKTARALCTATTLIPRPSSIARSCVPRVPCTLFLYVQISS